MLRILLQFLLHFFFQAGSSEANAEQVRKLKPHLTEEERELSEKQVDTISALDLRDVEDNLTKPDWLVEDEMKSVNAKLKKKEKKIKDIQKRKQEKQRMLKSESQGERRGKVEEDEDDEDDEDEDVAMQKPDAQKNKLQSKGGGGEEGRKAEKRGRGA